jgi:hypothetical protein
MAKSGLLGVGAVAASSSVFPCDVARPSYCRHGPGRLIRSMDVVVPSSKGEWWSAFDPEGQRHPQGRRLCQEDRPLEAR